MYNPKVVYSVDPCSVKLECSTNQPKKQPSDQMYKAPLPTSHSTLFAPHSNNVWGNSPYYPPFNDPIYGTSTSGDMYNPVP